MNKKLYYSILLSIATALLSSCGSVKNVAYFQNSDSIDFNSSAYLYDARIMPKDVLSITVSTVNPEASAPYNLIVRPTLTSTSSTVASSGGSLQTYLVGCIYIDEGWTCDVTDDNLLRSIIIGIGSSTTLDGD